MLVLSKRNRSAIYGAAVAGLLAFGASAHAGLGPLELDIQVTTNGGTPLYDSGPILLPGTNLFGDFYQYDANNLVELQNQDFFTASGEINANNDISLGGLSLGPVMNFVNTHNETLEFVVTLTREAAADFAVNWSTSSAWNLGGGPDPELMTLPGQSLWTASVDGNVVGSLYDDPSGMGGGGDLDLSTDPINGSLPGVTGEMSITLAFQITPGADGGVNGILVLVPAPGALAMLGLGLVAPRRRRRA